MISQERIEHNQINCQIPTLLAPQNLPLLGLPLEGWVFLTRSLGYDGMEWRPVRALAEVQLASGQVTPFAKANIKSAEQSYRRERSWQEASQHPNKRLTQASFLLFTHKTDSLRNLIRLQALVGEIPFTIYPTENQEELELHNRLKNRIVQLAPDLPSLFRAGSLEDLVYKIDAQGYGINLDLFHYQRLAEFLSIPADNSTFRSMTPFIKEVQFPVGRNDFHLSREDQSRYLLENLLESGYTGPVVPEINPSAYGMRIFQAHREIVKDLRNLLT